jgi:hypothetical protein
MEQAVLGGGVKRRPHIDPKVQNGHITTLDKIIPNHAKCDLIQQQLRNLISDRKHLVLSMQLKIEIKWLLSNVDLVRWFFPATATIANEGVFIGC